MQDFFRRSNVWEKEVLGMKKATITKKSERKRTKEEIQNMSCVQKVTNLFNMRIHPNKNREGTPHKRMKNKREREKKRRKKRRKKKVRVRQIERERMSEK